MSVEEPSVNQPNKALPIGFLPDLPVEVTVTSSTSEDNLRYDIRAKQGEFEWSVNKKLMDVVSLALRLNTPRKPSTTAPPETSDNEGEPEKPKAIGVRDLLYLTSSREHRANDKVKSDIKEFFDQIFAQDNLRNHASLVNFFELSGFSFKKELGMKGKEGFMSKKTYYWYFPYWSKRWYVLKDRFLLSLDTTKTSIEGVFLFDGVSSVTIEAEKYLKLANSSFEISLSCANAVEAESWRAAIALNMEKVIEDVGSPLVNSYGSFSPSRNSMAHWFVDGADFFSAVANSLESAKNEIFITGWMIMPQITLKRMQPADESWMLQSVLERKAKEGVKVYILIYDGPEAVINLGETYVKETLEALSDNIVVLPHRGLTYLGDILWSHHEKLVIIDQSIAYVSGLDLTIGRWDMHKHPLTDLPIEGKPEEGSLSRYLKPLWKGIDYVNDYIKAPTRLDEPTKDHLDRKNVPRMPWHDVGSVTYHENARDVARHFIQRWNFAKAKLHRQDNHYPFLVLKSRVSEEEKKSTETHPEALPANVQVLRSSSDWSAGLQKTENSIHQAYISSIENAEHFIYIENQFFISVADDEEIENQIVSTLIRRIEKAKGTRFRVYVVIPLIPALEGDFSIDAKSQQIQIISHYQYRSMTRGKGSIVQTLMSNGLGRKQIKDHISFCALRSHSELNGEPITEVLYVHSKMMVVDDKLSIIGSANINDRSMLGDRDSEVALCIKDIKMVETVLDGKKHFVGKFSSTLRKRLFAEHLGMLPFDYDDEKSEFEGNEQLNDVVSDDFYHGIWTKTVRSNTRLYDEAFKSIPANRVKKFSEVDSYRSSMEPDKERKREILAQVSGNLVKYPTKYLEDENLEPDEIQLQLAPAIIFT